MNAIAILSFVVSGIISTAALALDHFEFGEPVEVEEPILENPVGLCRPYDHATTERLHEEIQFLRRAVSCGDTAQLREALAILIEESNQLDNSGDLGNCYEDKGYTGDLASTSLVTKSSCKDIGGKSWIQRRPSDGTCQNLK
jgi:hypothetical protein